MKKIIVFSYLLTSLLFLCFSFLFVDPNLIYIKYLYSGFAFTNRAISGIMYLILILLMFFQFLFFLKIVKTKEIDGKFSFLLIGVVSFILLFSYPAVLSYDIFNYFSTAKVAFHYFENPYIIMPIELVGDPMLLFTQAANKLALYGPFWISLTGFPFLLGLNNFILTIINLKILVIIFYFLTSYLVHKISKSVYSLAFFALNPLVIIETLISGHNDIVMAFFALSSLYLLQKKKIFLSILFLLLSILIKYATLFLVPVFCYFLILKIKGKLINLQKLYLFYALSMFLIFLLSSFREEIYPWYAVWFLVFVSLTNNKLLKNVSIVFSFGLLLRYLPYMVLGTYFGPTPYIKIAVTFIPALLYALSLKAKKYVKAS